MDNSLEYDEKKVRLYQEIQKYVSAGYSQRQIMAELHCSSATVIKYRHGDYEGLCRKNFHSGMDQFYDYIIKALSDGASRKDVYRSVKEKGYKGGQSAAYDYMNKIVKRLHLEIAVYKSSTPESMQKKKVLGKYDHLTRNEIIRFLWLNAELTETHKKYVIEKYPQIGELKNCIREFREIYEKKNMPLLYLFIEKYKRSGLKTITRFANGLERDLEAVENSVASSLSNGFVEGTNSKLKMIKRTMYGRCGIELLSAKLMYEKGDVYG